MPVYHVKDPDTGLEVDLRGESPPSEAELTQIFSELQKSQPRPRGLASTEPSGTNTALGLAAARTTVPIARRVAEEVATNPNAWKMGRDIGQAVGGVTGLMKGGPIGAAGGMYVGGKAGWRLTNAGQRLAAPVARAMETAAPYAQALGTLSGAQGIGDLAQMAEPARQDIGFLGIGPTTNVPGQRPALLNALATKLMNYLTSTGMAPRDAARAAMAVHQLSDATKLGQP